MFCDINILWGGNYIKCIIKYSELKKWEIETTKNETPRMSHWTWSQGWHCHCH